MNVVLEAPKAAVPVGTVEGSQSAGAFQSLLGGFAFHRASCAVAASAIAKTANADIVVSKSLTLLFMVAGPTVYQHEGVNLP